MLKELQREYRLSVLKLLAFVAVLGISPFAFVRFFQGNFVAATIDLVLVLGILGLVGYALRTKKTRVVSLLLAVFICIGVVAVVIINGLPSFLWVYPVFMAAFFLVKPIEACIINSVAGVSLAALSDVFEVIPLDSFVASIVMLSLISFVFASQSVKQLGLLETLNTIDPLTGAMNRRALEADMAAALSSAERNDVQQALVMLDLDFFKVVNDKYGHDVGDKILTNFVKTVTSNIRKSDRVYRYGGEEFALLVYGVDAQQQRDFISNLQTAIKNELRTPDAGKVTASFGVAAWMPGTTADGWLKRSDKALYLAKDRGRNCAVFSDE
jgi:diguanylate cyclase (GGDEF)-like protein